MIQAARSRSWSWLKFDETAKYSIGGLDNVDEFGSDPRYSPAS